MNSQFSPLAQPEPMDAGTLANLQDLHGREFAGLTPIERALLEHAETFPVDGERALPVKVERVLMPNDGAPVVKIAVVDKELWMQFTRGRQFGCKRGHYGGTWPVSTYAGHYPFLN